VTNLGNVITISPGEWFFGFAPLQINTLLGSCVAVAAWHNRLLCGGMCHYLLPHKSRHKERAPVSGKALSPRYGEDALTLLTERLTQYAPLKEYLFSYFGGATMFEINFGIGDANCALANNWLRHNKVKVQDINVGGNKGRKIVMELHSGKIDVNELNATRVGETNGDQCFSRR